MSDTDDEIIVEPAAAERPETALDDSALDQSEIDGLFGIGDDDGPPTTGIEALLGSKLVQPSRLPQLDACVDRLVKALSGSMRRFTSANVELSLNDTAPVRFSDYIEAIPMPALLSVFKAVEWNGPGLIMIDSPLIYSIVDMLLGGRRSSVSLTIEGRSFTSIEARLIERMVGLILEDMSAAFAPVCEVAFEHERLESNPGLASIAQPNSTAIVFKFDIDMEERGGRIEILIPDETLEPVRNLLQQAFMGEKFGRDTIWMEHWTREMRMAEAELEVSLGEQTLTLSEVMALDVGSTLQLNSRPQDVVTLTCGDIPLLFGKVGRVGEQIAVRVENWVAPSQRQAIKERAS